MATKVRNSIIEEVKHSKYYSIIVDSTPDISHVDQLSFVVRYVPARQGKVIETFVKCLPNVGHKAKEMFDIIVVALGAYDLNFEDCHRQFYDNTANMVGCYTGLQAQWNQFYTQQCFLIIWRISTIFSSIPLRDGNYSNKI